MIFVTLKLFVYNDIIILLFLSVTFREDEVCVTEPGSDPESVWWCFQAVTDPGPDPESVKVPDCSRWPRAAFTDRKHPSGCWLESVDGKMSSLHVFIVFCSRKM